MDADLVFRVVDVTGVVANGLLGGAVARAMRFDLIGFLMLGMVSGLGGGMMRDALLQQGLPVAFTDHWYLTGAFAAATVSYLIELKGLWARRFLALADVLALGCWSATGASKALSAGLDWVPAIFLGVLTAVGGGMLRDVLVGKVPAIFGGHPLYATFSVIASTQMVVWQANGHPTIGMASAIVLCGVFGLAARHFNWMLPPAQALQLRPRRGDGSPTT